MKIWFLNEARFVTKLLGFSFSFTLFLSAFFFYDRAIEENSLTSWSEWLIRSFMASFICELLFNYIFKLPGDPGKKIA